MRAVQLTAHRAPLVDSVVPDPEPGPGEVLIAVRASGICHSDAHYRSGDPAPSSLPITLGHEIAGEVVALGPGAARWQRGDQVTALVTGGGYAQYCTAPAVQCLPLPDGLSLEEAAQRYVTDPP